MVIATDPQVKEAYTRAQERSRQRDPRLQNIRELAPGRYEVTGRCGVYTVTVTAAGYACTCTAGQNNLVCAHMGSAYRLRICKRSAQPVKSTKAPLIRLEDPAVYWPYEGN